MDDRLGHLVRAVADARTFEQAATVLLRALLGTVEDALRASAWAEEATLVRGMVHLRPGDEYRQLVVMERRRGGDWQVVERDAPLTSATAFRWVAEHRCPVSVDVRFGKIQPHTPGSPPVWDRAVLPRAFNSDLSFEQFSGRNATHVHVIPLRTAGPSIHGLVSLEVECATSDARGFVWETCQEQLALLVAAVGPHLLALPLEPVARAQTDELLPVVGASMAPLVEMLRVFALQEETILIGGPTGAGKSRIARWCHHQSARRKSPFESLDLNTVPEDLQLPELFGWKKGAFTGAVKDSEGAMARAEGGTLFIDEIDKLSLKAQAGLLHVLEERRYRALGAGGAEVRADVRFLVGSNADLRAAVGEGRFREDLYYRINVLPVKLPPLDRRRDEIPQWARFMLDRRHRDTGRAGQTHLAAEAEAALGGHAWPGNLRQLDNIVRRAYTLALMDAGAAAGDLTLSGEHVARALAYESGEKPASLIALLDAAAAAFVAEAEKRRSGATPLDLDLAEAFRGFVLAAAEAKTGSKEEALTLFGKEAAVAGRNHHKLFKRELGRIETLCKALGVPVPSSLAHLLEGGDGAA